MRHKIILATARFAGLLFIFCLAPVVMAEESIDESINEPIRAAEMFFVQGDFQKAIEKLHEIRSMIGPIPNMTHLGAQTRARVFFDLGCCYLALNDSTQAEAAFQSAFQIDSGLKQGFFQDVSPGNFWQDLLDQKEQARRLKTKRFAAGARSFLLPGWGQHYRGYKKKGLILNGIGLAAVGYWVVNRVAFQSARSDYKKTVRSDLFKNTKYDRDQTEVHFGLEDTNQPDVIVASENYKDDKGMYSEFEARHRVAQKASRRTNRALAILGGIWAVSVFDSVIWEPNQVKLRVNF